MSTSTEVAADEAIGTGGPAGAVATAMPDGSVVTDGHADTDAEVTVGTAATVEPEGTVGEVERVDGVERALRTDLADAVRAELVGAGLPVVPAGDGTAPGTSGAELEVDLGDDAAGGVFVTWRAGALHVEAANRSLIDGGFDDSASRRTDVIANTMRDSIITILAAAGFDAAPSDDEMRPLALRVRNGSAAEGTASGAGAGAAGAGGAASGGAVAGPPSDG